MHIVSSICSVIFGLVVCLVFATLFLMGFRVFACLHLFHMVSGGVLMLLGLSGVKLGLDMVRDGEA